MILLNGIEVKPTIFPDKTSQVWKIEKIGKKDSCIDWRFECEAEVMHLAQLKMLLDSYFTTPVLIIRYLPYGRQDKPVSNETTFALHSFANILNSLNFNKILIHDPHSHIALKKIKNSIPVYPKIEWIKNKENIDIFCYPDNGAKNKYSEIQKVDFIYAEKIRDQSSGKIIHYKLNGDPSQKNILIVDDICDGGATFVMLANLLKEKNANKIDLFVSHGLFTNGTQILKEAGISKIFTWEGEVE